PAPPLAVDFPPLSMARKAVLLVALLERLRQPRAGSSSTSRHASPRARHRPWLSPFRRSALSAAPLETDSATQACRPAARADVKAPADSSDASGSLRLE